MPRSRRGACQWTQVSEDSISNLLGLLPICLQETTWELRVTRVTVTLYSTPICFLTDRWHNELCLGVKCHRNPGRRSTGPHRAGKSGGLGATRGRQGLSDLVHVDEYDRRGEEREHLRHQQSTDDRIAQRLPEFGPGSGP